MEIVVSLDHSALAERAVAIAHGIASATDVDIRLVTVTEPGGAAAGAAYLRSVAVTHLRGTCAGIEVMEAQDGVPVARSLLGAVERSPAPPSILCLSSHGRSGLGVAILGSTAEDVLRRTRRAVLVVGRRCDLPWPGNRRALVLPVDGSPRWKEIVPVVLGLVRRTDLEPVLVEVTRSDEVSPARPSPALEEAEAELARCGLDAKVVHRFGSNVPVSICEAARDWGAALVAMSVEVDPGPQRALHGNVTARTIRDAPCPVVVAPRAVDPSTQPEVW